MVDLELFIIPTFITFYNSSSKIPTSRRQNLSHVNFFRSPNNYEPREFFLSPNYLLYQKIPTSAMLPTNGDETAIFPFTKTPSTINFKLLPTSRQAPLSGRPINSTCHHSSAIHSTYITTYYISKKRLSQRSPTATDELLFKTSLSGNIRAMPMASGILQNAVIVS